MLALVRAEDFADALSIVNGSRFGNAASLFTDRGSDARQFRHTVEAGNLGVNTGTAAPMAFFHFGGWKDSFFGDLHAQGEDMIHFYTTRQSTSNAGQTREPPRAAPAVDFPRFCPFRGYN
nr:aldehyde dehydrogenase family protein [Haladaptatus sp. W1]